MRAFLIYGISRVRADVAGGQRGHSLALEGVVAVAEPGARVVAAIDANGRDGGRVSRFPDQTGDMVRLCLDEFHVTHRGADVFRRDIAAAERLHVPAVRAEDRLAIANLVVPDDDALAAAEIQPSDRGFVGHAAG